MKDRQSLALIVAVLGVYLLAHGVMAGYGLYLANEALRPPVAIDGPYLAELRDGYPTLVMLFVTVAALGSMSITASFGFLRGAHWAGRAWLVTSAALVACIALAVAFLGIVWTHYLYELVVVGVSWWYALRLRKEAP